MDEESKGSNLYVSGAFGLVIPDTVDWNQAGLRGGFRVELLPEGADPMDARYNVVQWINRNERGWSVGGSLGDPRTGEILDYAGARFEVVDMDGFRVDRVLISKTEEAEDRAATGALIREAERIIQMAKAEDLK